MKRSLQILLGLVVILLGSFLYYKSSLGSVDSESDVRQVITIPKGESSAGIADLLEQKEIIKSPFVFKAYLKIHGQAGALQAGSFVLRSSMTVPEVVAALTQGAAEEAIITIPEGFTLADIDTLLAEKGIAKEGEILECAKTCNFETFTFLPTVKMADRSGKVEGYLYPDTYFVNVAEFVPKFFIERLLTTFKNRVVDDLKQDITASKRSLHEIVTMASLIEEETRGDSERSIVAGILWKRYDEKMGLGVDATVRYILDKKKGALTASDLDTDSPYNLRKYRGLPPGPIANPSMASIKAALHPKESPYYYYLHGSDGQIHYATTNEEHNANKAKYL